MVVEVGSLSLSRVSRGTQVRSRDFRQNVLPHLLEKFYDQISTMGKVNLKNLSKGNGSPIIVCRICPGMTLEVYRNRTGTPRPEMDVQVYLGSVKNVVCLEVRVMDRCDRREKGRWRNIRKGGDPSRSELGSPLFQRDETKETCSPERKCVGIKRK